MKKLIIGICVILVIAAISYFILQYKPQPPVEEGYILEDSLETALKEELEKISVNQAEFNAEVENDIANTLSMFYW
ncbi:MAG: hypothetical protein QW412_02870 [Candidatus Aenigmatarchaeota archaeon]